MRITLSYRFPYCILTPIILVTSLLGKIKMLHFSSQVDFFLHFASSVALNDCIVKRRNEMFACKTRGIELK